MPPPPIPSANKGKLSDAKEAETAEPHFKTRKKSPSPGADDLKARGKSPSLSRNNSSNLPKQLGTIEEDESEQKATISPSQMTKTTQQNEMDEADDETSKTASLSVKATAVTPAQVAIPSLNLDQDNLRRKTTENMKQEARAYLDKQAGLQVQEPAQPKNAETKPAPKLATEVKMRNPSPQPLSSAGSQGGKTSPAIANASKIGLKKNIDAVKKPSEQQSSAAS